MDIDYIGICQNCGKIMTEKYGSGRFCSKSCANTRHHSQETKQKISISNKSKNKGPNKGSFKKGHAGIGDRKEAARKYRETCRKRKEARSFDQLSLREQLSVLQEERCAECGIKTWQGKALVLELHHIDGNHENENLDNLKLLCPNCHSQTPYYRNRSKKFIKK